MLTCVMLSPDWETPTILWLPGLKSFPVLLLLGSWLAIVRSVRAVICIVAYEYDTLMYGYYVKDTVYSLLFTDAV